MEPERVAVVTGGASGIGRAICARLPEEGFRLAVLDLDGAAAAEAAGEKGLGLTTDVSDADAVDAAFDAIVQTFGRVDLLVNNAGIAGSRAATICHETTPDEWDRIHAVNVRGPYLCSRAALRVMLPQGSGHIVTIASTAGTHAYPGRCAYTASKGAALMLARSIAIDYAKRGIRSNAVCPGMTETPLTQWRLDIPELRAQAEACVPLGRVAQPHEIAEAVALLSSPRLTYMTGHALVIDGGWTTW